MKKHIFIIAISIFIFSNNAFSQEVVTGVKNPESLFTSQDPKLHANKQVVYHIIRDLLEANRWDLAEKYLSKEYLQHNPNAASGRDSVVNYFTKIRKVKASAITEKIEQYKIVAVLAEGDLVTVAFARTVKDEKNPKNDYTTTWFDMWRIKDGKAVEHWDSALKGESPNLR
nr:nuclear transport factor 2 family protein [Bacteriovorax sp. HI3]